MDCQEQVGGQGTELKILIDPSTILTGFELARNGWGILSYLRSMGDKSVISAFFSYDGKRIIGSDLIIIERDDLDVPSESVWFYKVKPVDGYVFLREPVNPSCAYEIIGTEVGELLPDANSWRWIAPVLPGRLYRSGLPANLKVDFLIFGYKPESLLQQKTAR